MLSCFFGKKSKKKSLENKIRESQSDEENDIYKDSLIQTLRAEKKELNDSLSRLKDEIETIKNQLKESQKEKDRLFDLVENVLDQKVQIVNNFRENIHNNVNWTSCSVTSSAIDAGLI